VTVDLQDDFAAGMGTAEPDGGGDRLAPGGDEAHPLGGGHDLGESVCDLLAQPRLVTDDDAELQDLPDGADHVRVSVAQNRAAVGHEHVEITASVRRLDGCAARPADLQVLTGVRVDTELRGDASQQTLTIVSVRYHGTHS
jgi:hypothetical protein